MNRVLALLAVVWTLLLCGIAIELYRIDDSLQWLSAPNRNFAAGARRLAAETPPPETEEQRKARIQAEIQRATRDFEYAISAPSHSKSRSESSRQTAAPGDRSR